MGIIKFNNVPSTTPGLEVETFPNYVAPEKEYQVTHVPGRNGDLVVDTKTYKNVPRSYKVSMAVEPPAVSVSGSTASFEATAERALAECKTAISSDVGKVGTTIINSATDPVENNEPYNFRAVPNGVGDRENDTLIGGTVAWNQLCPDSLIHIESTQSFNWQPFTSQTFAFDTVTNHNYLIMLNGKTVSGGQIGLRDVAHTMVYRPSITYALIYKAEYNSSGTVFCQGFWNEGTTDAYLNVFDLTQMFGSTIADYIYGLETATSGAGVAWFRNLFPKDYYAYNAGELISVKTEAHNTTGKNLLPNLLASHTHNGVIYTVNADGSITLGGTATSEGARSFHFYLPSGSYIYTSDISESFSTYDTYILKSGTTIARGSSIAPGHNFTLTEYSDLVFNVRVRNGVSPNVTIKPLIRLSSVVDATYEPYKEHIYPLNPALELRGIPKLNSSNKLYYDGDIYSSDGSVIRKYGIVDLGSLNWSYNTTYKYFWTTELVLQYGAKMAAKMICPLYYVPTIYAVLSDPTVDKVMATAYHTQNNALNIRNLAYTDAVTFKTAMSGVYLIYELATPVIESTTGLIDNVSIASFDDGADDQPVNLLSSEIVAVESGSGTKSPTNPYSISGFANGVVTRCGKNFVPMTVASVKAINTLGTWSGNAYTYNNVVFTLQTDTDGNITGISANGTASATSQLYIANNYTLQKGNYILNGCPSGGGTETARLQVNTSALNIDTGSGANITLTEVYNSCVCFIRIGSGYNPNGMVFKPMVRVASDTDDTFAISKSNTYTFAFGQTVYGGHFDNKGNLVVTHGYSLLNNLNWNIVGDRFYADPSNILKTDGITTNSSHYVPIANIAGAGATMSDLSICAINRGTNNRLYIKDTRFSDVPTFVSTMGSVQIIYELETPITLAITSQDITTLLGENNIFANTGNIKALSYTKQVCSFEPAQEVDDHGTEEYIDNREVAIPVGHESKYFTAGKIYNFSWLDEAGLIKEGELNADTGVLTITNGYGIVDLGDLTWTLSSSTAEYFSTPKAAISEGMIALSCSVYKVYTTDPSLDKSLFQTSNSIRIRDSSFFRSVSSSVVDPTFKSAMHGVKLLYELAYPVRTIQLTPVQIESLIGNNVLISESGNISVTPRTYSTYTEKMNAISDWLHSASGYARLEDTYEPDYYRKAYYDEQTDMENIFDEAGRATLKFVCKPQRYLKSGEEPIAISSGGLIQNRTRYEAHPILKVTTNNTQGSVAIGNHSITIKAGAGTDPITIDCELQDAWSGTSNKNSYIVLTDGEFPVIDPGAQTVTFDGGVQSVEVIPRWWTV